MTGPDPSKHILAIDTTAEFGSIALIRDGDVHEEVLLHSPDGFGHILFDHIKRLLALHGLQACDIDCFACASGPGSFTGVRVGLSAAKGLAEACGKPMVAVSNLQAVSAFGSASLRAAILDARRGEVYGALYNASLDVVLPETVAKFPIWLDSLPDGEVEFLSTDLSPFLNAFEGTRFSAAVKQTVPRGLAAAIGRIAARQYGAGAALDPAAIDANYVRRSDAELFWKE